MKFDIKYHLDQFDKLEHNYSALGSNPIIGEKKARQEDNLFCKISLKFIFLKAINDRLNIVTFYKREDFVLINQLFNYGKNSEELSDEQQEVLKKKLENQTEYLISKISEKLLNLSEIEVRKYNHLAKDFIQKMGYLVLIKRTSFREVVKLNLVPMWIDSSNADFTQLFLDNFSRYIICAKNSNTKPLTQKEKDFFTSLFSNELQNNTSIINEFMRLIKGKSRIIIETNKLLNFQLGLFNLHKFFGYFSRFKNNKINFEDFFPEFFMTEENSTYYGHLPEFFILNYHSIRLLLRNSHITTIEKKDNKEKPADMLSIIMYYIMETIVHVTPYLRDKLITELLTLMINYGFDILTIPEHIKPVLNLQYSSGEFFLFYMKLIMNNVELEYIKNMDENCTKINSSREARILRNIPLHYINIKNYIEDCFIQYLSSNPNGKISKLIEEKDSILSRIDKIVFLRQKLLFDILTIKKHTKPGIFGNRHIMNQISFYLTDSKIFQELIIKSYISEMEIIEAIEQNIPSIQRNLCETFNKDNQKDEVEYILSNMEASHFNEFKLKTAIKLSSTNSEYYDILMKYIDINKLPDNIREENIIPKLKSIDLIKDPDIKKGQLESLEKLIKKRSAITDNIEDSDKLPNSPIFYVNSVSLKRPKSR